MAQTIDTTKSQIRTESADMPKRDESLSTRLDKVLDELDTLRAALHGIQRNVQEIKDELHVIEVSPGGRRRNTPTEPKYR